MTPRDAAVIARAAEIIERAARNVVKGYALPPQYLHAEHADMLAAAKALREMAERATD